MTADFRLQPQPTPEERLIAKLRDWQPESGWGTVTIRVEYENGVPRYVVRLDGEESVKIG